MQEFITECPVWTDSSLLSQLLNTESVVIASRNDRPISDCASYRSSRNMHSCRRSLKNWTRRRREETPCCMP